MQGLTSAPCNCSSPEGFCIAGFDVPPWGLSPPLRGRGCHANVPPMAGARLSRERPPLAPRGRRLRLGSSVHAPCIAGFDVRFMRFGLGHMRGSNAAKNTMIFGHRTGHPLGTIILVRQGSDATNHSGAAHTHRKETLAAVPLPLDERTRGSKMPNAKVERNLCL